MKQFQRGEIVAICSPRSYLTPQIVVGHDRNHDSFCQYFHYNTLIKGDTMIPYTDARLVSYSHLILQVMSSGYKNQHLNSTHQLDFKEMILKMSAAEFMMLVLSSIDYAEKHKLPAACRDSSPRSLAYIKECFNYRYQVEDNNFRAAIRNEISSGGGLVCRRSGYQVVNVKSMMNVIGLGCSSNARTPDKLAYGILSNILMQLEQVNTYSENQLIPISEIIHAMNEANHRHMVGFIKNTHITMPDNFVNALTETASECEAPTKEEDMTKLYKITVPAVPANTAGTDAALHTPAVSAQELYGSFLIKDGAGRMVMELKGTVGITAGEVRSFPPEQVEEIRPWTFSVKICGTTNLHHYVGPKNCVKVDEILMATSGIIGIVRSVDTKSGTSTSFKGVIIPSTPINTSIDDSFPDGDD